MPSRLLVPCLDVVRMYGAMAVCWVFTVMRAVAVYWAVAVYRAMTVYRV